MAEDSRIPTSIRVDETLWKAVGRECFERDITRTDAIEEGLRLWLGEKAVTPPSMAVVTVPKSILGDIQRYMTVLLRGRDPDIIKSIKQLLSALEKGISAEDKPKAANGE